MYTIHKMVRSGQYVCFQGNCKRTYQNVNPFKKHLTTIHSSDINYSNVRDETLNSFCAAVPVVQKPSSVTIEKPVVATKQIKSDEDIFKNLCDVALSCVCDLYSNPCLNRLNAEKITTNVVKYITSIVCDTIKVKVETLITENNQKNLLLLFLSRCASLLDQVDSEYKFLKTMSEMKLYIPPTKKIVDYEMHDIINNGFPIPAPKKIEVIWIPLRNSFKQFFELPDVLNQVLEYQKQIDDEKNSTTMSNFVQGSLWQQYKQIYLDKHVIPYFLYYDDFGVNNQLGSHGRDQSIGGFYILFPTVPPKFQAKLENILLVMLLYSSTLK